jgi:molybdate transport system permease protein
MELNVLSEAEWNAIALSVYVAAAAVLFSLPFGVAAGWLLARKRFFGRLALETVINLPLVLPPVVTGYLMLVTFGRHGWLGRPLERWFGIRVIFDWKGAALASAIVAFPLMVRAIRIAFTAVDRRLEDAARTLGAGPLDTFFSVTFPLARRGVITGCVLAFARSLGEFGATVMIAGNIPGQTQTIPLYIYSQLETPGGIDHALGIVIVSILLGTIALVVGEWLDRRSSQHLL